MPLRFSRLMRCQSDGDRSPRDTLGSTAQVRQRTCPHSEVRECLLCITALTKARADR